MTYNYIKLAARGAVLSALMLAAPFAYAGAVTLTPNTGDGTLTVQIAGSGTACIGFLTNEPNAISGGQTWNGTGGQNFGGITNGSSAQVALPFSHSFRMSDWYTFKGYVYPTTGSFTITFREREGSSNCVSGIQQTAVYTWNLGGGGGGGGGDCGLGCGGIPTAYTANFSSSTGQAAAIGAVGDLSSFVVGYIPYLFILIFSLIIIVFGVRWIKRYTSGRGDWNGFPIDRKMHEQNKKDKIF